MQEIQYYYFIFFTKQYGVINTISFNILFKKILWNN